MTKKKPDFSTGGGGWVDPDFFPPAVRQEAQRHLAQSKLTPEQKHSFLTYANDMAQMIMDGELLAGSVQREQIAKVAAAAHALQNALALMSRPAIEAMQAHADALTWGTQPDIELPQTVLQAVAPRGPGVLLDTAWDWAQALQETAEYTVGKYEPGKTSKPGEMRARSFVSTLATYLRDTTGKAPPKDPGSWFAGVMGCLGAHMGLDIGTRLVSSGIAAIQ